ncbi:MAG: DUF1206 domain-containing protein [Acidobacteria bacterium]|nr:DUF1206 domain-containing protein [Acidobacteriota bacterium]
MSPEARSAEGVIPERLAAFGFLTRGIVYLLIGGIAARVAILQRGRATGPAGALAKILTGPGGRLVLWLVAAGLFAFVLFRVTQCVRTRRPLLLAGYVGSAVGGLVLAITAVRVLLHFRGGGGEAGLHDLGARVLAHAGGRAALGLGGAIAAVAGGVQAIRALLGKLPADFTAAILPRAPRRWAPALARVGVFAHGVVVAVVGYSVFRTGLHANPRELGGTSGALRTVQTGGGGPVLFALVAAGLIAYGLSLVVLAAHRRRASH